MSSAPGTWAAFAGVFFFALASAEGAPLVVADDACERAGVDIASFATCIDGHLAPVQPEVDAAALPAARRTTAGRYVYAVDAYVAKRTHPDATLLVDVRARSEVERSGVVPVADARIPYDGDDAAFSRRVRAALAGLRFGDDAIVVLICRDGTLAARAADALQAQASIPAFTVVDGFDPAVDPAVPGNRNGWKRAGLPWTASADASRQSP